MENSRKFSLNNLKNTIMQLKDYAQHHEIVMKENKNEIEELENMSFLEESQKKELERLKNTVLKRENILLAIEAELHTSKNDLAKLEKELEEESSLQK